MSISPIQRDHALAILRPNPMWIPNKEEREVINDVLLPIKSKDGRPYLYGDIDCWDANIQNDIREIRVLPSLSEVNPKMALLTLHRETTLAEPSFIVINGLRVSRPVNHIDPFRQYFDGYTLDGETLGHVAAACVDFEQQKIWTQDSQGVAVKPKIRSAFEEHFPDFEFIDLQIKQQWDAHSCSLITMYNLECFSRGEIPTGYVDVEALRLRYVQIIDQYDVQQGVIERPTRYYEAPPTKLRYVPI